MCVMGERGPAAQRGLHATRTGKGTCYLHRTPNGRVIVASVCCESTRQVGVRAVRAVEWRRVARFSAA